MKPLPIFCFGKVDSSTNPLAHVAHTVHPSHFMVTMVVILAIKTIMTLSKCSGKKALGLNIEKKDKNVQYMLKELQPFKRRSYKIYHNLIAFE